MSKIYVFGHKNPDTDSIMSALVYSRFLQDQGEESEAIKIGTINKESEFILDYVGIQKPRRVDTLPNGSKVFLVDHNEKKQTINDIDELEIIGLIDHHNFGSFSTQKPIFIRTEVLGCTCSILYKMFRENNYEIPQKSAKMMISAIISDTLFFRSPTTTKEDKKIVEELNKIAQIDDLEKYSIDMFDAKSDLGDISAEKLVKTDFKEYDAGENIRIAVGVMETVNFDYALGRKNEILEAMRKIKKEEELDFILFSIINILEEENLSIVLDDGKKIIYDVFGVEVEDNLVNLGNKISRKKQIIPFLLEYFEK